MKTSLIAGALSLAAVAMSGCSSLGTQNSSDLLKQLDTNFAQCERMITFSAGVGVITPGANVSGSVHCLGTTAAVPAAAPVAAPAAVPSK